MGAKLIAGAVAGAFLIVGCGGGSTVTSSSTSSTTTTTTTTNPDVAISQWGKEELAPLFGEIADTFTWLGGALRSMDFADARAGCREMDNVVDRIELILPAPDTALNTRVTSGVDNLRGFTRECQGISPGTTDAELDQMSTYREAALADFEVAADMVASATSRS